MSLVLFCHPDESRDPDFANASVPVESLGPGLRRDDEVRADAFADQLIGWPAIEAKAHVSLIRAEVDLQYSAEPGTPLGNCHTSDDVGRVAKYSPESSRTISRTIDKVYPSACPVSCNYASPVIELRLRQITGDIHGLSWIGACSPNTVRFVFFASSIESGDRHFAVS